MVLYLLLTRTNLGMSIFIFFSLVNFIQFLYFNIQMQLLNLVLKYGFVHGWFDSSFALFGYLNYKTMCPYVARAAVSLDHVSFVSHQLAETYSANNLCKPCVPLKHCIHIKIHSWLLLVCWACSFDHIQWPWQIRISVTLLGKIIYAVFKCKFLVTY